MPLSRPRAFSFARSAAGPRFSPSIETGSPPSKPMVISVALSGAAPGLIVRYTLRAVSDMGAENISYESVRCGTREWRTVALYRPGAGWQRPVHDEWRPLLPNTIQHLLRNGVLCSGGGPAGAKASDLAYRVRHWDRYADAMAGRNTQ